MKEYYTIGETASLLGVSTQTLRHYDKIGLVTPGCTNEETGYRYYSFDQFHVIDRIKYLQSFGLTLEEIGDIVASGSVDRLLDFLEKRRKAVFQELRESMDRLDSIQWYMDYFTFMSRRNHSEQLYKVQLPKRYAIAVNHNPGEVPISNMEVNLARVKGDPALKNLRYLRQYAYLVDYGELVQNSSRLLQRTYWPLKYFIYLKEKPDFYTPHLLELPAGEYLCYRARILTPDWDAAPLREFFAAAPRPPLVIANEFEENLTEFLDTTYELQMLLV